MARSPWSGNLNWRRWARIALALSALLHLLFFFLVNLVYTPLAAPPPSYRVLLEPPATFTYSDPIQSLAPSRLPIPRFSPDGAVGPGQSPSFGMGGGAEGQGLGPRAAGLVRGSNLDPRFVAIHLRIAYNGDEPDRSAPDVTQ